MVLKALVSPFNLVRVTEVQGSSSYHIDAKVLAVDHSNQVHLPAQIVYDLLALDDDNALVFMVAHDDH